MVAPVVPPLPQDYVFAVDERLWDIFAGKVHLASTRSIDDENNIDLLFARVWKRATERRPMLVDEMLEECEFNEGRVYDNQKAALEFLRGRAAGEGVSLLNFLFQVPDEVVELFAVENHADMATMLLLSNADIGSLRVLVQNTGKPLRARHGLSLSQMYEYGTATPSHSLSVYARHLTNLQYAGLYLERGISAHAFTRLSPNSEEVVIAAAMHRVDPMYAVAVVVNGVKDVSTIVEGWENGQVSPEYLSALSTDGGAVV